MSPAPQIAGHITAMSEPASMAYPSVGLNLNYKLHNRGTREKGIDREMSGGGEERQAQGTVAQMAFKTSRS